MHEGETYLVSDLNLVEKVAYIHKADVDYFTQSVTETRVQIEEKSRIRCGGRAKSSSVT